jgi:membrane-associated phospholipid phosphatase
MLKRLFILLFSVLLCGNAVAQNTATQDSYVKTIGNDLSLSWKDAGTFFASPAHFSTTDWLITGGVLSATAASMFLDNDVRTWSQHWHTGQTSDNVFTVGRVYGEVYSAAILGGGLYAGGLVSRNADVRSTGRDIYEAVLFGGIITTVTKTLVGRSRPYTNEGPTDYRGLQFGTDHTSFPSGHSTVAFAISAVLASHVKETWFSIFIYSLSSLTAASRIYLDKHWLSDVVLGSAIGYVAGQAVVKFHEKSDDTMSVQPQTNNVLSVQFKF